ncbi:hypothetical protein ACQVU2_28150 [Bacillus mycoides]
MNKNYFGTNDLSGSARILASPSREPLFCFLSVGLARKAYDPFLAELLALYIRVRREK